MRDGIIWVRIYEKSAAGNLELFENASILNASTSPDMTQALLLAAYQYLPIVSFAELWNALVSSITAR